VEGHHDRRRNSKELKRCIAEGGTQLVVVLDLVETVHTQLDWSSSANTSVYFSSGILTILFPLLTYRRFCRYSAPKSVRFSTG
jgi:hypothetical protein